METKKTIKITKLIINNFRNIEHLEIDFGDKLNLIQGYNGLGKTTILSAITWCLFGKLYDERKTNIAILPIKNDVEQQNTEISIKVYLNGKHVLERRFNGEKSSVSFGYLEEDGKEVLQEDTMTNFNKFLAENYVDIEEFKQLSNLSYVVNLPWKELRTMVYSVIGEITSQDVFKIKEFPRIKQGIELFGFSDLNEKLSKDSRKLLAEIVENESSINNLNAIKMKHQEEIVDEQKLVERRRELQLSLENYSQNLEENSKRSKERNRKYIEIEDQKAVIRNCKNELQNISKMEFEYSNIASSQRSSAEQVKSQELMAQKSLLNKLDLEIEQIDQQIKQHEREMERAKQEATEIKSQLLSIDLGKCKFCGQPLPKKMLEEKYSIAKAEQDTKIQECKTRYDGSLQLIRTLESKRNETRIRRETEFNEIKRIENSKPSGIKESDEVRAKRIELKERKEKANDTLTIAEKTLAILENEYSMLPPDIVLPSVTLINEELEQVTMKISKIKTFKEIDEQIKACQQIVDTDKVEIENINEKIKDIAEYVKIHSQILQEKVKDHFKIASFITEEFTKEGKYVETFKIAKDNIPFIELNTATKIKVALDLLEAYQISKGIKAPILIDNCESIIDLPKVDTQMIVARCIKQDEPKIEIVKED